MRWQLAAFSSADSTVSNFRANVGKDDERKSDDEERKIEVAVNA